MSINKSHIHDILGRMDVKPDPLTMKELIEYSRQLADLDRIQDENDTRHDLTKIIFQFIAFWMICILIIVVYTGKGDLHFSDSVIITLITTTTANVLGFGIIAANYLFRQPGKKRSLTIPK